MDFGLITDPLKGVPFNWREVPNMKNHTPRDDRGTRDADAEAREARQVRRNSSRGMSVTGRGLRSADAAEDQVTGDPARPEAAAPKWGW